MPNSLQAVLDRYQTILDHSSDAILIIGADGRIVEANAQAHALAGYRGEDRHPPASMFFSAEELARRPLGWEALSRGEIVRARRDLVRADGTVLPIEVVARQVDTNIVALIRDVSEKVRAEEELRRLQAMNAALADLTRHAIAMSDPAALFALATSAIGSSLSVDLAAVVEYRAAERNAVIIASHGYPPGSDSYRIDFDEEGAIPFVLRSNEPLVVQDWETETRCKAPLLHRLGVNCGVTMRIEGSNGPYGILGAHSRSKRTFSSSEILFLRSMANVLSDFVGRIERERQTQRSLRLVARQHEAVAQLGRHAVTEKNLTKLYAAACKEIRKTPGVVAVLVTGSDRSQLLGAAGDPDPLAQLLKHCQSPRCGIGAPCMAGVDTVVCASIASGAPAEGLLAVQFDSLQAAERDAWFVQSIATITGDAATRLRAEEELATHRAALSEAQRVARTGSWKCDLRTGTDSWSDELYRILGVPPRQITPSLDGFLSFVDPEERQRIRASLLEFMSFTRPARSKSWEAKIVDGAGREKFLHITAQHRTEFGGHGEAHVTVQDITARRIAEDELFRRGQELKAMIDDSPDYMSRYDREYRHLYTNASVARVVGLPIADIVGKTAAEVGMPPEFCEGVSNAIDTVFATGLTHTTQLSFQMAGKPISLDIRTAPQFSRAGEVESVIVCARDVTEPMRTTERLAAAQRIARVASWEWDVTNGEFDFSIEMKAMMGLSRYEEITLPGLIALVAESDRPRVDAIIEDLLRNTATESSLFRFVIRTADGSEKVLESHCQKIRNADGAVVRIMGATQDITDRIEAAAERERLTRRMELLLESTQDGIIAQDREGRATLVNAAACRILGYSAEEILGRNVHELVHGVRPDGSKITAGECRIRAAVAECRTIHIDETLIHRDGRNIAVEVHASPMIENGVIVGSVVSFTDVTDRRELEERVDRSKRLASLGQLAATMAHEFNNVLMGIQPFAEIVQRRAGENELLAGAGRQILQSVNRGRGVTQEVLRFSRPTPPARTRLHVQPWLDGLLPELRNIVPASVSIRADHDGEELLIEGDGAQLAQIVTNLVSNARDAMPNGGEIAISVGRCRIGSAYEASQVRSPHRFVHLQVSDTGQGIPAAALTKLFEPFFTTKRKGTGLGLSVAQQIVEAHGGKISVQTREGDGTTFHVFLPLADSLGQKEARPEDAPHTATPRSVLIIEDDEEVALALTALLDERGYSTRVAASGQTAVADLARTVPDAVILDVGLPDTSGIDLYHRIATLYPDLPVLFSSGHADRNQVQHVLSRPHVAFLMKPYGAASLFEQLETIVGAVTDTGIIPERT